MTKGKSEASDYSATQTLSPLDIDTNATLQA